MLMSQKKEILPHPKKKKVKTKSIEAGGGVVFRKFGLETQVLLIYRNGVWDIPKGKREKKETREECARREVMEEVNADSLPKVIDPLKNTFHSYIQKEKLYNKTTFWFSMFFEKDQNFSPQTSEGIEKVEWAGLQEAKQKVGYKNLVDVLVDFEEKIKT